MRRGAGNAVARVRGDAGLLLATRYREALDQRTWFVGPMLFAAGAFDRFVRLLRLRRTVRDPRTVVADHAIARWRGRRGHALTLLRAAVGGTSTLSMTLRGPPGVCASVTGLRLDSTELDTHVSCNDDTVRLAAEVPHSAFAGPAMTVHIMAGTQPIIATVPVRSVMVDRFGTTFATRQWPPRFALTADRALVVEGRTPATASVEHEVAVGITSVRVTWAAPDSGAADLRLVPRDGGVPRVIGGVRAGGDCLTEVDLRTLLEAPDAVWDVCVSGPHGWVPLSLAVGENPTLNERPDPPAVPLLRPDGSAARVRVDYTGTNQLSFSVEALR